MVKEGGMGKQKPDANNSNNNAPQQQQQQQQDGIVLRELHKRVRNTKKKLARVEELEQARANGAVLTAEQLPTLASKPGLLAVLEELNRFEPILKEAVKDEVKQESQAAVEKHEKRLRERLDREQQQREQQWQAEKEELVKAKEAAEEAALKEPSADQMQELLKEPLHKLLQLLYFSEVCRRCMVTQAHALPAPGSHVELLR
eukprot:1159551-Pelagomonas_calceolata.AAC.11